MRANRIKACALVWDSRQYDLVSAWRDQEDVSASVHRSPHSFLFDLQRNTYNVVVIGGNSSYPEFASELLPAATRLNSKSTMTLILADSNKEDVIVDAFEAGADHVLYPATSAKVLSALINRALSREFPYAMFPTLTPYEVDWQKKSVTITGNQIQLTNREFDLFRYLLHHRSLWTTRVSLQREVWGLGKDLHTRRIETHICRLRAKLQLNGRHGWHLVYDRTRLAYRLCDTEQHSQLEFRSPTTVFNPAGLDTTGPLSTRDLLPSDSRPEISTSVDSISQQLMFSTKTT
ncbi:MAG: winged helix-turn-helix domain-containing protein [Gammaproteobacteria bacterium]|nr:winged helix-turn-helix domain-containing protein [Gammaproteobacteria bacterium]